MYAEVTVVVDGVLDAEECFPTQDEVDGFVGKVEKEAKTDLLPTEVYILWHDHEEPEDPEPMLWGCQCAQYLTDHHPTFSWNT